MAGMYHVIRYRLSRNTKPIDVLTVLESLLLKCDTHYSECLFRVGVSICEFEFDGKVHSNRRRNAVNTLLRRYPELEAYCTYTRRQEVDPQVYEEVSIQNFTHDDYSCHGQIRYDLIHDIVTQVPRPYGVNDLHLIYNGIRFAEEAAGGERIRSNESGFGSPVGDYIWYSRTSYGDEKHAYITFAAREESLVTMRQLFFELAAAIPGRYEGTELYD